MPSIRIEMHYYTYAYLREDRTPYYIGKGKGYRINSKQRSIKPPKDKSRIIFLKKNLTEEEAFRHEIYMIAVFGRKDLKTGILHNLTDGGEGSSGAIISEFERQKRRDRMNNLSKENHPAFGKRRQDISKIMSSDKNPMKNPEIVEKFSGKNSNLAKRWKVYFDDGRMMEFYSIRKWCLENNYNLNSISRMGKGKGKRHKDIVKVEVLQHNAIYVEFQDQEAKNWKEVKKDVKTLEGFIDK